MSKELYGPKLLGRVATYVNGGRTPEKAGSVCNLLLGRPLIAEAITSIAVQKPDHDWSPLQKSRKPSATDNKSMGGEKYICVRAASTVP